MIFARTGILPTGEGRRGLIWDPVFPFHAITHVALRGTGGFLLVQDMDPLCSIEAADEPPRGHYENETEVLPGLCWRIQEKIYIPDHPMWPSH